jgi:hypothetical protein
MFEARWERRERRQVSRRIGAAPVEPGSRPRPDLPAGADLLPKIKHIVVLTGRIGARFLHCSGAIGAEERCGGRRA